MDAKVQARLVSRRENCRLEDPQQGFPQNRRVSPLLSRRLFHQCHVESREIYRLEIFP